MQTGQRFFVTWMESDKAEIIEDVLDGRAIPIEMLPTPEVIRDQVDFVMVCKDCFEVLMSEQAVLALQELNLPAETRCFNQDGKLLWNMI